jgi:hypothetical protein
MDIIYTFNSIKSFYKVIKNKKANNNKYINNGDKNTIPLVIRVFMDFPKYIIDDIYIGNIFIASNWSLIRDYDIKYIINLCNVDNYFSNNKQIIYKNFVLDEELKNLDELLDYIINIQSIFSTDKNKKRNILLHSFYGNNLTCVVIIAYLIYKYNFSFKKATLYVCKNIENYNINKKYYDILKKKYE